MMIASLDYPLLAPGLDLRPVGDEYVVHDTEREKIHVLNGSAGIILTLCDGAHSIPEIAAELCRNTGATSERVESDVRDILQQFRAIGLVRPAT